MQGHLIFGWPFLFTLRKKCMGDFVDSEIEKLSIHYVGNKIQEEDLNISEMETQFDDNVKDLLIKYFTKPFKDQGYFRLHHESELNLNEVFHYAYQIFSDPSSFHQNSIHFARHLYAVTDHPNIKSGELYVTLFKDCYYQDNICDAIGIFKSENKETFLKVYPENQNYHLEQQEGININKLDKGCIIYNLDQELGYRVQCIDNTNKGDEARYWLHDFLQARPLEDNYYQTQNYLQMCKEFTVQAFPNADRIDQISLENESARYFKENETFEKADFLEKVLQQPDVIEAFEDFKEDFAQKRDIKVVDEFDIESKALKKMKRVFKSVIKLDKNFHIYVHGNRSLIRKGFDEESNMHFYQLFFKEEE